MMAIAMSETMQTPPTSEPAIRESCCPNSDLYSSGNRHMTAVCKRYCRRCSKPSATRTHPAEHLREGKMRAQQCFFCFFSSLPPVAHEVTFVRLILRRNSGPHTGSQSRAEFNYFTARFSLLLSLSNSRTLFPLHYRTLLPPTRSSPKKNKQREKNHTLTVGESLEEHVLAVGTVSGHGPCPHLDHVAGPGPETLQDDTGGFALHD